MRNIIQANIKVKDGKGHVRFLTLKDIVPDSIVLKSDKKAPEVKVEKKSSKKDNKKSSKK